MGMAAGQARLLSITTRLTDNELKSQMITNSKLRLADKSTEASEEYMDALNTQQLMFCTYDDNGSASYTSLTANTLMTYSDLKNQYAIVDTSGRIMVSSQDAENFEKSDNLWAFLTCYNLMDTSQWDEYQEQLEKYNNYTEQVKAYNAYINSENEYSSYQTQKEEHDKWLEANPDYYSNLNLWQEYGSGNLKPYNYLDSQDWLTYREVAMNSTGNLSDYITSAKTWLSTLTNSDIYKDVLANGSFLTTTLKCDGTSPSITSASTYIDTVSLSSFINDNVEGSGDTKTLRQKIDDIQTVLNNYTLYLQAGYTTNDETILRSFIVNAINNLKIDLSQTFSITEPQPTYEEPYNPGDTVPTRLAKVEYPEYVEKPTEPSSTKTITDKSKGQWYINLWYAMNGSESVNKLQSAALDDDETNIYKITNANRDNSKANYKVIEDNLLNSSEWLQFALENGVVTLQQAQYYNPSENGGKVSEITSEGIIWNSIVYTSAADFVSLDNETAIAVAEVKYKNALTEIENKDNQYDQDLKNLDTEHSALQTEYESIKETISKNVERSFKAFS